MKTVFLSGEEEIQVKLPLKLQSRWSVIPRFAPLHQLVPRFLSSTELDRLFSERARARRSSLASNSRLEG